MGASVHGLFGSVVGKQGDMNDVALLISLFSIGSRTPVNGKALSLLRVNYLINSVKKI